MKPIKPLVNKLKDGSLLIEWIHPKNKCRFFITIEKNIKESHWGFVSKCDCKDDSFKEMLMEGGELPKELLERLTEEGEHLDETFN